MGQTGRSFQRFRTAAQDSGAHRRRCEPCRERSVGSRIAVASAIEIYVSSRRSFDARARGNACRIAALPPELARPQRELLDQWRRELAGGAPRIGWKIGHGIPEVEALAGDRPVIGYLDARTLVQDGGEWTRREGDVRAETEFGVVLRSDVAADTRASDAAAAIAGLCVALEIVDLARSPGDIDAVMRGNVFHRAVAFGPTRPVALEHLGSASLHLDDAIHEASEPMPDPIWVVQTVADALAEFGEVLLAGDRVLSGSFVHHCLGHASTVTATIENLGSVGISIGDPR